MHRRFRTSTKQKSGLRLRTLLYVGTVGIGLIVAISMFVVQFLKEETGLAASNPMVIYGFEITQDTTAVFRGTNNQLVLKLNIKTKGNNHKLSLNSIELSARGTSEQALQIIENAKLWATGDDAHFSNTKQLGSTIKIIPKGNFLVNCTQTLRDGNNYFWLTYDISATQTAGNNKIDAECISFKIGTLDYESPIAAPPGSRKIINNIPYFSTGNGDLSSLSSWNSSRDGSGKTPSDFNQQSATFHIQAGHIMENKLSACIPVLLIERNGFLNSSSDIKTNLLEIESGGTYLQNNSVKNTQSLKSFKIDDGGNFIHANNGRIPGAKKLFETNSNVVLTSYSESTFCDNVVWGNLTIDAGTANSTDFGNAFKNIRGNFEIRSTGINNYLFTTFSDSIKVGGNLIINGGTLILGGANNTVNLVLENDLNIKKGNLSDRINGKTRKGNLVIEAGNKISILEGTFTFAGSNSTIIISKNRTFWIQQPGASVSLPDVIVYNDSKLEVKSEIIGPINAGHKMVVQKNGVIILENSVVKGSGSFVLEAGATISTAHASGINSAGETGCIQTKERTFNSAANYYFTGSSTPQQTGVFTTIPESETVNKLGIAKSAYNDVLILEQNFKITDAFVRTKGSINKNTYHFEYYNTMKEISFTPGQKQDSTF